jgi:lipopolysaccharide biosynthesis glycosyltransferase
MKKDLLVTLADRSYINQAKQIFSCVYWNAGWRGDYMLLSHEIPEKELKWFRDKGILTKKCKPISSKNFIRWPACVLSKFYLFTSEFKKWKNIVFLDADIIVRASLDELAKIKGFAVVQPIYVPKLINMFNFSKKNKKLFIELGKDYNLKESAFGSAAMAFNTDIIKKDTFSKLKRLFQTYREIVDGIDGIINLCLYKKWTKLPLAYDQSVHRLTKGYKIKPEKVKGIILHFPGPKPWDSKDFFYNEWKYNLERAEQIDLNKIQSPAKRWSEREIKKYGLYLERKYIIFLLDRYVGLIGIFLKNNFPKLYFILKRLKNE